MSVGLIIIVAFAMLTLLIVSIVALFTLCFNDDKHDNEGSVTVYPKPDNPHKSPIAPKTKEGNYVVVYKNGKEVARYKADDES